ncbi:HAD-IIB family hydrolase [Stieleria sp. JC731]|uniref:HAD-IIB family hydrolase n=1 Tax=Pirellulaceae TaxID=2691357 RepID=UPI001E4E4FA8|nr:HAD-IIB family hydrolase [Stieleria sp. JC731]MCC9602773.1 HAD-IIB family hydrolase [Stieleria sp. JC731]
MTSIHTLATDLDGTLIPLDDSAQFTDALSSLKQFVNEREIQLLYVSGRSWNLVSDAIEQSGLPFPDAAICDVGTTIYVRNESKYEVSDEYADCLRSILSGWRAPQVLAAIDELDDAVWQQPADCQTEFKMSFFFELSQQAQVCEKVDDWIATNAAPVSTVVSRQIEGPLGLIDVLPSGVHKGFALRWWFENHDAPLSSAVYCGDSGNDSAAMTCGVNGVVVGNADDHLCSAMKKAPDANVYFAKGKSTIGVFEGLRHFCDRN